MYIEKGVYHAILSSIIDNFDDNTNLDYLYYIFKLFSEESINEESIINKLQDFIKNTEEEDIFQNTFIDIIKLIDKYVDKLNIKSSLFLDIYIVWKQLELNIDDINIVWNFLEKLSNLFYIIHSQDLLYYFKENIEYYLIDKIQDEYHEVNLEKFVTIKRYEDWEVEFYYDESDIIHEIENMIDDYISEFTFNIIDKKDFDTYEIFSSSNINIKWIIDDYIKGNWYYDKERFTSNKNDINIVSINNDIEIDNLFHRDV